MSSAIYSTERHSNSYVNKQFQQKQQHRQPKISTLLKTKQQLKIVSEQMNERKIILQTVIIFSNQEK